jgi:hypothetical protein
MESMQLTQHVLLVWMQEWLVHASPATILNFIVVGAMILIVRAVCGSQAKLGRWHHLVTLLVVSTLCLGSIMGLYVEATRVLIS